MLHKLCIFIIIFHQAKFNHVGALTESPVVSALRDLIVYFKQNPQKKRHEKITIQPTNKEDFYGSTENFKEQTELVLNESTLPLYSLRRFCLNSSIFINPVENNNFPASRTKSTPQLIRAHSYKMEIHGIQTEDGYLLNVHRILPKFSSNGQKVVLHHGILGNSEDWLLLGPGLALPYLLSDHGYDVWLLNARGNKYSRKHVSISIQRNRYWGFSFHEMGIFDLPAALSYISDITGTYDLHYIGHSMGATALLVCLSTKPRYNTILKSVTFLAPLAFMQHATGPLKYAAELRNHRKNLSIDETELAEFGAFSGTTIKLFCRECHWLCSSPLLLMTNAGREFADENIMRHILGREPTGASTKTLIHYMQLITNESFRMFDYGPKGNLKRYNTIIALEYKLQSITVPISIFTSTVDYLSSPEDIMPLLSKLKSIVFHYVVTSDFGHMDFVWSKDAPELIFSRVLDFIQQFY